jgi:phenylacetate-CoA ligase
MTDGTHYDLRETRSAEQREAELMAALPGLIAHAKAHAPGWSRRLVPFDARDVHSRKALAQIPVLRKSDLKALQEADPPFGGFNATPVGRLSRLFMSPGPLLDAEACGPDPWRAARALWAAGIRPGMIVHNCFAYHLTPGAWMVDAGARQIGCAVIPAGVGQTEQQLELIARFKPDAYVGTPSFLRILIEKSNEGGASLSCLRRALVAAEALPPSLRQWFHQHGVELVLQWYGTADLGLIAYESPALDGMILDEDLILEIVRPGSNEPVAAGEVGEVVITSFNRDYPLIRFGTGDLSAVMIGHSPCGRTNVRIRGWLGRADQITKVRGMFVHPAQVAQVLARHPELARARLVVSGALAQDELRLHCEPQPGSALGAAEQDGLRTALIQSLREITGLRAELVFVAAGALPNDGKVIADERNYD